MKRKRTVYLVIMLMVIGFAAVATTLYINGNALIGINDTFEGDVIFTNANVENGKAIISQNGKMITFETEKLKSLDQVSTLEYTVTNNSTQYDANVEVMCDYEEEVSESDKGYITWENTLTDVVEARSSENGTVDVKLIKVSSEPKNIKIACEIQATALEREVPGDGEIVIPEYFLRGIAKMKKNEEVTTLTEGTLVFYSENYLESEIESDGKFAVSGLERGSHEVYYVGTEDIEGKTKEEIASLSIGYTKFATSTDETTIVLECINDKCPDGEEYILDEIEFEVDPDTIPKAPGIYDLNGDLMLALTSEMVEKTYPGQYYGQTVSLITYYKLTSSDIGEVVIPEGTKYIAASSFSGCNNLTKVTLPNSLEEIKSNAFYNCSNLKEINLPSKLEIIDFYAFNGCHSITSIGPKGSGADLEIPSSLTTINRQAFSNCKGLVSVDLPDTITKLGYSSFENCTSLKSVKLSKNLSVLESSMFKNCTSLTSVGIESSGADIEIPDNIMEIEGSVFYGCTGLTEVELPDTVTKIGSSIFYNCTSLSKVSLSKNIEIIPSNAFYNCKSLKTLGVEGSNSDVEIPNKVITIDTAAFSDCSGLTSVNIPGTVLNINNQAFYNDANVVDLTINEGVETLGKQSFFRTGIDSVYIPASVKSIEFADGLYMNAYGSFDQTENLVSITIDPNNQVYTSVNDSIIYSKDKTILYKALPIIDTVSIPSTVNTIHHEAFYNCNKLTSIYIPDSVTSIGNYAFAECSNITSIRLSNNITSIPKRCFENVYKVSSLTIPSKVEVIDQYAFSGWTEIKSLTLPSSVTTINYNAFYNCVKLNLTIPSTITKVDSSALKHVFNVVYSGKMTLRARSINGYIDGDYVYTSSTKKVLSGYRGTVSDIVIPSTVTTISESAFESNTTITSVELPEGLTTINDLAFYSASNLKTVTLPSTLKTIGSNAFDSTGIQTLTVPSGVTSISYYAFYNIPHVYYSGTATGSPWGAKALN